MKRVVIIALLAVMLVSSCSASFLTGNQTASIKSSFASGESLSGWINISIQNEPSDSLISSNFPGSIKLIDFLENNSAVYACNPLDCMDNYIASNSETSKSFSLQYNQEKIISFRFNGKVSSVDDLSFNVSVQNAPSCISPLEIDILNDKNIEWKSKKFDNNFVCTVNSGYGCFNPSASSSGVRLKGSSGENPKRPYCEKISLPQGGNFSVGAWVQEGSFPWNAGLLKMELYSLQNDLLNSCDLPEPSPQGGEINCTISYDNPGIQDYYVCIAYSDDTDYNLTRENSDTGACGFHAIPGEQSDMHDYYIFARGARYSNIGDFSFNQNVYETQGNSGSLLEYIQGYLQERFNNNCTSGCIVPIKFKSYGDLDIQIKDFNLEYSVSGDPANPEHHIYDTASEKARINSGFQKLDLSYSNITISGNYGNQTLNLLLGGSQIISQKISVISAPMIKGIIPNVLPAGAPVKFSLDMSIPANKSVVKYTWDFGDNSDKEDTATNSATHNYAEPGTYIITITIQDNLGVASTGKFNVVAGDPLTILNSTLKDYRQRINNLTSQVNTYPAWYKNILEKQLDLDNLDNELTVIEKKFAAANGEDDYINLMLNLSGMQVPKFIGKSSNGNFPVLFNVDDLNFDYLKQLGAGIYDENSTQDYKNGLIKWLSNINAEASYFTLSAYYDTEKKDLLNYFNLNLPDGEQKFLIVSGDVTFNSPDAKEFDGASGVALSGGNIEFIVSGEMNPLDLNAYLSPEFKNIEIIPSEGVCNYNKVCDAGENWRNCRNDCSPTGLVIIFLVVLALAAFLVYFILQEWYKRKYENYLFPNRNDLFNLVNFIDNALTKGMQKQDIEKDLRKMNWNSEQISYALKKVKGKKTGMPFEINIPKKKTMIF